jgi:hypothetical protein
MPGRSGNSSRAELLDLLARFGRSLHGNWTLKVTALGLAFLLWSMVRAEAPARDVIADIPVRVVLRDADWVVVGQPDPPTVNVVAFGPTKELVRLRWQRPELVVPVDQVRDSVEMHVLRTGWVTVPGGLDAARIEDIRPGQVRLTFDAMETRLLPIALPLAGTLPEGLELAGPIVIEPPAIVAHGAVRRLAQVDSLRLPPLQLGDVRGYDTLSVAIDTVGLGVIMATRAVRVIVPARPVPEDRAAAPGALPALSRPAPGRRP